MGACCRTLQEGFAPAALAPVCLAAICVHPPPNVTIGATPLYNGVFPGYCWINEANNTVVRLVKAGHWYKRLVKSINLLQSAPLHVYDVEHHN